MKVAIVHDWLLGMRGGERVLEVFCELFPDAVIYTGFLEQDKISSKIKAHKIVASSFSRIPGVKKFYRYLLPLFPILAAELGYRIRKDRPDLVISISHCFAKNVRVPKNTYHLCYCLTPMRYIWDKFDDYFAGKKFEFAIKLVARMLRVWDRSSAKNVDSFVCISNFVKDRIQKVYNRNADVIYPPVRTDWIQRATSEPEDFFLCVNALVPYKNTESVVEAFNRLGHKLYVVGGGPEEARLKSIAGSNIEFFKNLSDAELADLYKRSKALVFAAEEDFGMIPVEVQAAGRPVICYKLGGSLETVKLVKPSPTGIGFSDLSSDGISAAIQHFLEQSHEYTIGSCVEHAKRFGREVFVADLSTLLVRCGFSGFALKATGEKKEERVANSVS